MKKILLLFSLILTTSLFAQADISGFVTQSDSKKTKVNLIQINEAKNNAITATKIVDSAIIDNNGFFRINKKILNHSRFYYLSVGEKNKFITSKKFLLGNNDSIFFEKSIPLLSKFKTTSLSDKEWRKLIAFEEKIDKKKKYLEEVRAYTKDSLQILAVKLISLKTLDKKHLLEKDIALNKNYYAALLQEFQESNINPEEYLFFELKLAQFQIQKVEENYTISKSMNVILGLFIIGILFFMYRTKNRKTELTTLSKQELAIKKLILQQKSNKEIATELFISVSTVKTHITNLYKKLHVVNRSELQLKFKNSTGTST